MIEAARGRVGMDDDSAIVEAEAGRMPIETGSIDVAVAVRLFVHVRDLITILHEMALVVRPGGALIVEFPNRHHLLASIRYLAGRQQWSPAGSQPHEYLAGHFAHQPATIERQLRLTGFAPDARRAVSRSARRRSSDSIRRGSWSRSSHHYNVPGRLARTVRLCAVDTAGPGFAQRGGACATDESIAAPRPRVSR